MSKLIEVRLPKQRLFFTEEEFQKLLYGNPDIWKNAIGRGKGINRAERASQRQAS